MLRAYTTGSQQCVQLQQLNFSTELVGTLGSDMKKVQDMYHKMQALILACKNDDKDYEIIVNEYNAHAAAYNAHAVAAKALLQSAAPKKQPNRKKVIPSMCCDLKQVCICVKV